MAVALAQVSDLVAGVRTLAVVVLTTECRQEWFENLTGCLIQHSSPRHSRPGRAPQASR